MRATSSTHRVPQLSLLFSFQGGPMLAAAHSVSQTKDPDDSRDASTSGSSAEKNPAAPQLLACLLLLPSDSEPVMAILRKLTATSARPEQANANIIHGNAQVLEPKDSWLDHNAAAQYLGISKSTLYRYAEQERIESCKLGGRLEYRLASLDKFKDQHVRPARRSHRSGGIIAPALSSGK